jgi:hypothetical protein
MYPSRMTEACGLSAWYTNSEIVHAVADVPTGPYVVVDTAIPRFAHEGVTSVVPGGGIYGTGLHDGTDPWPIRSNGRGGGAAAGGAPLQGATTTATTNTNTALVMVHAGCGNETLPVMTNCSGGATRGRPTKFQPTVCDQYHVQLSTATSVNGPWTPVAATLRLPNRSVVSNPALSLALWSGNASDGGNTTTLLVFKACDEGATWPCTMRLGIAKGAAPDAVEWTLVAPPGSIPNHGNGAEDPFLWRGRLGWHILYHGYDEDGVATGCGGHAFSRDLVHWHDSSEPAYTLSLEYDDGTIDTLARRERPQLVVSTYGDPLYLTNGVQPSAANDSTFTLVLEVLQTAIGDTATAADEAGAQ